MDAGSIFLILALALAVGVFIARPFLFGNNLRQASPLESNQERSSLLAERDRILTALQELDFDYRLGKIPEEDYPETRNALKQNAAVVLRRLDDMQDGLAVDSVDERIEKIIATRRADAIVAHGEPVVAGNVSEPPSLAGPEDDLESLIAKRKLVRQEKAAGFCPKCGKPAQKSDRFCSRCGATLTSA